MSEKKQLEKCCNPNPISNVVATWNEDEAIVDIKADYAPADGCKYRYVIVDFVPNDDQARKSEGVYGHQARLLPGSEDPVTSFRIGKMKPGDSFGKWIPRVAVMADCGLCPFVSGAEVELVKA